jgi:Zn-dependent protease
MDPNVVALGLIWYVVFLLSLTCHEASHGLAAKWGGDLTAFRAGQVTLSPLPHMQREPFGTILVPLLSYALGGGMIGWASAPYDPFWAQRHPKRAAWMSLAGPTANFLLVVLAGIATHAGILTGYLKPPLSANFTRVVDAAQPGIAEGVAVFLSILFSLNLLLGVFNLLPVPPLDGYSVLALFLPEDSARKLEQMRAQIGMWGFLAIMLGWSAFNRLFWPVFSFALNLLYPFARYG